MSRFIVLSGPSCIGKGPLYKALKKFYPDLGNRLKQLVLYNDRAARPGEEEGVDYFFRPRAEVEAVGKSAGHVLAEVRGDLQALEKAQIERIMDEGLDPFFEGNPFVPAKLREAGIFDQYPTLSVFLSPLSKEEILYLKAPARRVDLANFVTDVQRRKLLHRTKRQKVNLSLKDLENIEKRAGKAIVEMREAWKFDHVIPLHDAEGNDNWDAFYFPIGDARKAMETFAALLSGQTPPGLEKWDADLIP
jgi:guanylate kinase